MAQEFIREHKHEETDAKVGPLATFLIVMGAVLVFSFLLTVALFDFFAQRVESKGATAPPMRVEDELPPRPHLQVVPGLDLTLQRQAERQRLDGYGWVDEANKVVHVPIDKAIDALLEKDVESRADGETAE